MQIVYPGGNEKNHTVVTLKLVPETYYYFISAGSTMDAHRDNESQITSRISDIDTHMKEREDELQADRKAAMWTAWVLGRRLFPGIKLKNFFHTSTPKSYAVRLGPSPPRRFLVDSGVSYHLISYKDLTKEERRRLVW